MALRPLPLATIVNLLIVMDFLGSPQSILGH
jgi:hypothetical protein